MSKQTKLERLEAEAAATKAALDANLAKRAELGVEARDLQTELREGKLPALERIEAEARLKEIDRQLDRLHADAGPLSEKKTKAAHTLFEAKKSLANAERVLEVVKDPPGWMEASPAELRQNEQRAKQVIQNLTR